MQCERGVGNIHFSLTVSLCFASSARKQIVPREIDRQARKWITLYSRAVDPDYIFFDQKLRFTYVQATAETFSPQMRTSSTSKTEIFNFFPCLWVIFALLSRNFIFDFLHKKTSKNCKNYQRSCKK
jgi:hypothetical protein